MSGPEKSKPRTRSGGPVYDPDLHFPPMEKFQPTDMLPTIRSVISCVRNLVEGAGATTKCVSVELACREVAKKVYSKWYTDTICCVSITTIQRRLVNVYKIFTEGKKRLNAKGKENSKAVLNFKDLADKKNKLFDVFQTDKQERMKVQEDWGVKMSKRDFLY